MKTAIRALGITVTLAALLTGCAPVTQKQAGGLPEPAPPEAGSLKGSMLVAAPGMPDPRFRRTVIFVVSHGPKGAMGLVVNRAVGRGPIEELLKGAGLDAEGVKGDISVHYGGPVRPGAGFVLHSKDYAGEGTLRVTPTVSMSTNPQVLRAIGTGTGPKRSMFAVGYAGWGPDQLDKELARRDWLVIPADDALIFDHDMATKWRRAMDRHGVEL